MKEKSALSLGEKIKQIRKSKGLSVENLARAAGCNISTISRIESGEMQCSDKILEAIKKYMGIEGAPLLEDELIVYKGRLNVWEDMAQAGRVADSRAMQKELFPIHELPYEHGLSLHYSMIDIMLYQREGNIPAAEEKIKAAESYLDGASDDLLIAYHCNKGYLVGFNNQRESLKHYLQAFDLAVDNKKPVATIALNIGLVYEKISQPHLALIYLERANAEYKHARIHATKSIIDGALGSCYMKIGKYKKASSLFKISLAQSESINYQLSSGLALCDMGNIFIENDNAEEGIRHIDKALPYLEGHNQYILDALCLKAYGLIRLKKFPECEEVLIHAKSLIDGSEMQTIRLETLSHAAKLSAGKSSASADYLEHTALPYLKTSDSLKFLALTVCDMLETYYKKKRNTRQTLLIIAISRDIYKNLFFGDKDAD